MHSAIGPCRYMDDADVTLVYAASDRIHLLSLKACKGTTVREVIRQSGILGSCPELELEQCRVGVFNKVCSLSDLVSDGDRIEIYRPLRADPKEARRQRVARRRSGGSE